jgi:hypothetical protein
MKAKIAYMNSKGQAVYPDANSTLRVTFGKIAGPRLRRRRHRFVDRVHHRRRRGRQATGEGEFNAPPPSWPPSRPRTTASTPIRS